VPNRVHGVLDPEPDLDDLLHGGHRIGHVLLHSAESQEQNEIKKLFPSTEKNGYIGSSHRYSNHSFPLETTPIPSSSIGVASASTFPFQVRKKRPADLWSWRGLCKEMDGPVFFVHRGKAAFGLWPVKSNRVEIMQGPIFVLVHLILSCGSQSSRYAAYTAWKAI
jgi:hypothetical protein